jgi:hypothetical protein
MQDSDQANCDCGAKQSLLPEVPKVRFIDGKTGVSPSQRQYREIDGWDALPSIARDEGMIL